jgi:hypothetical protein
MTGNSHVRFGRGPSGKGPTLVPRPTAYLAYWRKVAASALPLTYRHKR